MASAEKKGGDVHSSRILNAGPGRWRWQQQGRKEQVVTAVVK
jgi:hypothetical protein